MRMSRLAAAAAMLVFAAPALSAVANCYSEGRVPLEKQTYVVSYVVLLDETVELDATQRDHVREQLERLLAHGNELRVVTFSAFRDGRYTLPVVDVRLAMPLSDAIRSTMRKDHLRAFDHCQVTSFNHARRQLAQTLRDYFDRASSKLANSDIIGTLKEIGDSLMPSLRSKHRRLVMVSDMLENSSLTSFYGSNGAPRAVDALAELSKVERQGAIADFRGAAVYVIGAGVAASKPAGTTYRSQAIMGPLKAFWVQYFEKSNARMVEFGQPLLLNPIGGDK